MMRKSYAPGLGLFCGSNTGFSLIELMVSLAIVATMASIATPMVKLTVQRQKEQQFRQALHEIRHAIDAYKKASDAGHIKKNSDSSGYPPTLQVLVDGVEDAKDPKRQRLRFLRKLPIDPMLTNPSASGVSGGNTWGLRSYESPPDQPRYVQDVYDIYSLSPATGINGIPYAQW